MDLVRHLVGRLLGVLAILLFMAGGAGCSGGGTTSVSTDDISKAEKESKVAKPMVAAPSDKISDSTGIFSYTLPTGFVKVDPSEASGMAKAGEVTLFAQNDEDMISVYVTRLGSLKTNSQDYFQRLKGILEDKKEFKDIEVSAPENDIMRYKFAHDEEDGTIRECCDAIVVGGVVYTACSVGLGKDFDKLSNALGGMKINKPASEGAKS